VACCVQSHKPPNLLTTSDTATDDTGDFVVVHGAGAC